MKHTILISILFFFFLSNISAQRLPIRWGKISKDEVNLSVFSPDKEAAAIMLCKYGRLTIDNGYVVWEIHERIKILKPEGVVYGTVTIPYFNDSRGAFIYGQTRANNMITDGTERICYWDDKQANYIHESARLIKAQTFNYDGNNETVSSISKEDVEYVDITSENKELRFQLPDVKVGSIIEYIYTISTDNWMYPRKWNFHSEIPTLRSEAYAEFEEWVKYSMLYQGALLMQKYNGVTTNSWVLENLPALKQEPFSDAHTNYSDKITFQLVMYYKPSELTFQTGEWITLNNSWEGVIKKFKDEGFFGYVLLNKPFLKNKVQTVVNENDTKLDMMKKLYYFVSENMVWNGEYALHISTPQLQMFDDKKGNNYDINMLLCDLLRAHDIDAKPVLISTRDHGLVSKVLPILNQFNHILVLVTTNSGSYLLDATNPFVPFNLLPTNDLNSFGLILNDNCVADWFAINQPFTAKQSYTSKINIEENGNANFSVKCFYAEYFAIQKREEISRCIDNEAIANLLINLPTQNCKIDSLVIENKFKKELPLIVNIYFSTKCNVENNTITIEPILRKMVETNPFQTNNRWYPINFNFPQVYKYFAEINFPQGYTIEGNTANEQLSLFEDRLSFEYKLNSNGNVISLSTNVSVKETVIEKEYFTDVKNVFTLAEDLWNNKILMKKVEN